jgi:dolichol-phosphate mannosyltransferase
MDKVTVISPLYKSEKYVTELYQRISQTLNDLDLEYEIIFVDDCYGDRSLEIARNILKNDKMIIIIKLSRNFGQHAAINAGINNADGDWLVVIDSDLQDSPEEIKNLYKKAKEGYDIVLAKRLNRKDSFIKKSTSFVFSKIASYMSGFEIDYRTSNYGIYSKRVIENYKSLPESKLFFPFIVQWLGFPKSAIEVEHSERLHDKSSYRISKLLNLAFDSILYSSTKPLLTTIKIGLFISALSFIYSGYIIFKKFAYGIPVLGWASTTASIWFLSGLVITVIGVVGAYVGKVFEETKKRPMYIIEDIYKD